MVVSICSKKRRSSFSGELWLALLPPPLVPIQLA
jgi:hypothetical protein